MTLGDIDIPGLSRRLTATEGPHGLRAWSGTADPVAPFEDPIPVSVIVESDDDVIGPDRVGQIVQHRDALIGKALTFLRDALIASPGRFSMTRSDLAGLEESSPDELPVDQPQFVIWPGDRWSVHFQVGEWDICDPYGIAVVFTGMEPAEVEDLSECGEVDD